MTKILLSFLVFVSINTNAQTLSAVDTSKYRIDLPEFWKAGNRIWRILSDKLPMVSPELKDKELCGDDCNPKYRVELYLSDPELVDFSSYHLTSDRYNQTWQHITYYAFECNLVLFDENNTPVTRFIIVDKDEIWTLTNKTTTANYSALSVPMKLVVSSNPRAPILVEQHRYTPPPPTKNDKQQYFLPMEKDMLIVVDNKISKW